MILSCPSCKTRYVLDPARLRPSGRDVRCARCGHVWREAAPPVAPDEADLTPPPPSPPPPPPTEPAEQDSAGDRTASRPRRAPPERRNLPALRRERPLGSTLGWLSLGLFVAVVIGAVLLFPAQITRAWPPAQQLYNRLGLEGKQTAQHQPAAATPAAIEQRLRFADLAPAQRFIDGVLTLVITGRIDNIGETTQVLPPVEVVLLDGDRLDLRTWTFRAPTTSLAPGESVRFETSLENPPPEAQDISVTFSTARPGSNS